MDASAIKLAITHICLIHSFYLLNLLTTVWSLKLWVLLVSLSVSIYDWLLESFCLLLIGILMIIAERTTGLAHNNRNKRRRVSPNTPVINCDFYINLESTSHPAVIAAIL